MIKKKMVSFIGIIFVFLIFMQHRYAFISFDDYGYASLSYGWTGNTSGMAYTVPDVFSFLKWHYLNWGGRVLYFFFEIMALKTGGTELIQTVQAVIIILICIVSGKIVAVLTECDEEQSIALSLILYGTFTLRTVRDGIYWYSASVSYVWPLLPLLGCVYFIILLSKRETGLRKYAAVLLAFPAAFSQEQMAVLIIVWIIMIMLFTLWEQKKVNGKGHIPLYLIYACISAVTGGMITILAPGNFARAGIELYDEYYSKNILIRLIENTGKIVNTNIGFWNWVFLIIMTIFCGTAVAVYFKSRKIFTLTCIFTGYYIVEQFISDPLVIGTAVRVIWAGFFFVVLSMYYYRKENYWILSMLIAGICSQAAMVVSPTIYTRCHTMMEFILHIVLVECIISIAGSDVTKQMRRCNVGFHLCAAMLCIYALFNLCSIIGGYKENDEINRINHYKLTEAGKKYQEGKTIGDLELYKLYDDRYTTCMPYQEGYEYIEWWMKNYYELPADVRFEWSELGQ